MSLSQEKEEVEEESSPAMDKGIWVVNLPPKSVGFCRSLATVSLPSLLNASSVGAIKVIGPSKQTNIKITETREFKKITIIENAFNYLKVKRVLQVLKAVSFIISFTF